MEAEELDRLRAQGYARVDVPLGGGGGGGDAASGGGDDASSVSRSSAGRGSAGRRTPSKKRGAGKRGGGPPKGFLARMAKHDEQAQRRAASVASSGGSSAGAKGRKKRKAKQSVLQKVQAIQKKRDARRQQQQEESRAKAAAMKRHGGDMDKAHYCGMIDVYRRKLAPRARNSTPIRLSARLSVCVRKRPMNSAEMASKRHFDVMTCVSSSCLVVHEPKVKLDMSLGIDNHEVRLALLLACGGVAVCANALPAAAGLHECCSSCLTPCSTRNRATSTSTRRRCGRWYPASSRKAAL